MKTIIALAIVLQATASPPPVDPAAPLAPSGKWTIDYREDACILSRAFGTGKDAVTVGFNPSPLGSDIELVTARAGSMDARYRKSKGKLILQPSGQTLSSDIDTFSVPKMHQLLTTLRADGDVADALKTSTSVTMQLSNGSRTSFAMPGVSGAFAALKICQADLLKTWGMDPTERDRIKTAPIGFTSQWFETDDFPSDALSAGVGGTSTIAWTIGVDGKVSECRTVHSSHFKVLDEAACGAITRRGKYKPAIGMDDKPMVAHQMRRIIWRMPE